MVDVKEAGKAGGDARAKSLTKARRVEIARWAAICRWMKAGKLKSPIQLKES